MCACVCVCDRINDNESGGLLASRLYCVMCIYGFRDLVHWSGIETFNTFRYVMMTGELLLRYDALGQQSCHSLRHTSNENKIK